MGALVEEARRQDPLYASARYHLDRAQYLSLLGQHEHARESIDTYRARIDTPQTRILAANVYCAAGE